MAPWRGKTEYEVTDNNISIEFRRKPTNDFSAFKNGQVLDLRASYKIIEEDTEDATVSPSIDRHAIVISTTDMAFYGL